MNHDGRALTEESFIEYEQQYYNTGLTEEQVHRLIETVRVQRRCLEKLFSYFQSDALQLSSSADPVRNSELAYLKELVSMEERQ